MLQRTQAIFRTSEPTMEDLPCELTPGWGGDTKGGFAFPVINRAIRSGRVSAS